MNNLGIRCRKLMAASVFGACGWMLSPIAGFSDDGSNHAEPKIRSMKPIFVLRSLGQTAVLGSSTELLPTGERYMRMPDEIIVKAEVAAATPESSSLSEVHRRPDLVDAQKSTHTAKATAAKERHSKGRSVDHSVDHSESLATHGRSRSAARGDLAQPKPEETLAGSSSEYRGGIAFRAAKIKGVARLPRVKFARVSVPMEIRDESPSLDFTEKTLKDSGY